MEKWIIEKLAEEKYRKYDEAFVKCKIGFDRKSN